MALKREANRWHSSLEPKNVLLRNTECSNRKKAPSTIVLARFIAPDAGWDVRLTGVKDINLAGTTSKTGLSQLATSILKNPIPPPDDIVTLLRMWTIRKKDGQVSAEEAADMLRDAVETQIRNRPYRRAPRAPKKK